MTVSTPSNLTLAKMLKIVSKGMVYDQMNITSPMWDFVFGKKVDVAMGREEHYSVRTDIGKAACGPIGLAGGSFPASQAANILEATFVPKKFGCTIELQNSVIELALKDLARYGQPVAEEVEAKGIGTARALAAEAQRDGTGIVGTISSVAFDTVTDIDIVLATGDTDRGFIGWLDKSDKLYVFDPAGGGQKVKINTNVSTVSYFKVLSVNRATNTIKVRAYTSSDVAVVCTSIAGATDPEAADVLYRKVTVDADSGMVTDVSTVTSATERSTLCPELLGLEALCASSAMTVHGLLHGTDVSGTAQSCGGLAIDTKYMQSGMSALVNAIGGNRYKYKKAFINTESYDALVESRETDRRFIEAGDSDRGTKGMGFLYMGQRIEFQPDEMVRGKRIWVVPEGDVLQFHGSDFAPVKAGDGPEWHLKPNTTTYSDNCIQFMSGLGALVCVHPAGILKVHNFSV